MSSKKFRFYKKGGMEDMPISEGIIGPILTVVVIIAVSLFLLALWNWWNSNQENQASMNNFEELYRRIESLKDGEEVTHPFYLDVKYLIVGFEKDKSYVRGECKNFYNGGRVPGQEEFDFAKPIISCGNKGCLCLCDGYECENIFCKQSKFSIISGERVDVRKTGSDMHCEFGLIAGTYVIEPDEGSDVSNIYIKRIGNEVLLCSGKCT